MTNGDCQDLDDVSDDQLGEKMRVNLEKIMAMKNKIKVQNISQMIHIYPTMADTTQKDVNKFMSDK